MYRREFVKLNLAIQTGLAFGTHGLSTKAEGLSAIEGEFELFDQLHFKNKPNMRLRGFSPIKVVYADQMWPDRVKGDELDVEFLKKKYGTISNRLYSGYLCIDIEHWPYRRVNKSRFNKTIDLYLRTLSLFRSFFPKAKIGFFEFAPTSFYPLYDQFAEGIEVNQKLFDAWNEEQLLLYRFTSELDILFPQLYSRWPKNPTWWTRCANQVLAKSRTIAAGRPVIPFIWPQFWNDQKNLIPEAYWAEILRHLNSSADSAVVWSIYRGAPEWNETSGWWHATHKFLGQGNSPPLSPRLE